MNASAVATTCPRQPAKIHQRRVLVDVEFVTKEIRIEAEISCCPRCNKVNRCAFPETMPGPLQYGAGIVAFATDLMISQMVPLKCTAQMLKMLSGRQVS